jgi:hypothetical protein
MVLAERAPVSTREKVLVIPRLAIDVVRKHGYHVFIGVGVEMVDLVAFVENIRHHIGRRGVDYCRRYNVGHVSMIAVFGDAEFPVREELPHCSKMYVSAENRDADRFLSC